MKIYLNSYIFEKKEMEGQPFGENIMANLIYNQNLNVHFNKMKTVKSSIG